MNLGQKLRIEREKREISLGVLSRMTGISKSSLQRYETQKTAKIPVDVVPLLEKALNLPKGYLMDWKEEKLTPCDSVKIPVLGYVAAGTPIEAHEEVIEHIDISEDLAKRGSYFGLRIQGDSMEPRFYNGDIVVVREQKDVENGQIAIVIVNGDFGTCKKVLKKDNGLILQPLNQRHEPVFYSWEDVEKTPVTICGLVVGLRADIK